MDRSVRQLGEAASATPAHVSALRRSRRRSALNMFLWDQLLIVIGFGGAYWLRYLANWPEPFNRIVVEVAIQNKVEFSAFFPILGPLMLLLALRFSARGLYRTSPRMGLLDQTGIIVSSTLIVIALLIVLVFLYRPFYYSRLIFAFAGLLIGALLIGWRVAQTIVQHWQWSRGIGQEPLLVVGGTGLGQQVMSGIAADPSLGYSLVGYVDEHPIVTNGRATHVFRHLGPPADLEQLIHQTGAQHVVIALPFWEHGQLPLLVETCERLRVSYLLAPDFYQLSFDRVDLHELSGVPLLRPKEIRLHGFNLGLKRVTDVTTIVLTAPLTLTLAALIALAIRLDSPGPIIFRQQRVGKDGHMFGCYKFRTMVPDAEARKAALVAHNEADGPLFKMRDDPRVTRVGRFLRRSSLDELPQLWNVIEGHMSLIGPRPALPEEVSTYEPWQRRRLEVQPGCAGLVQALGRSEMAFDEQVRLDIYYAENWSIGMDLRILLMVIPAVIGGKGAY